MLLNKYFDKKKLNLYEAFSSSLVAGLAETYFIAFALEKGATIIESGLLASLPLIFASVTPFIFERLYHKYFNSSWVQLATLIQAISLICLVGVSFISQINIFYILLFIYSFYWFGHYSSLPSWNKWISELIPLEKSQKFFAQRTRITQVGVISGMLLGGLSLHLEVLKIPTYLVYVGLFLISFFLKFTSFRFFTLLPKSQTHYNLKISNKINFFKNNIHFFKYYSVFNCSLYLSAPYLTGYLITIRGLDYLSYMFVMGSLFVGKMISSSIFNRMKSEIKPNLLFFWGGLVAAPLPALWPFCPNAYWMSFVHIISGMGWVAWEMGLSLMIFKNIKSEEKIEAVSVYNTIGLPMQVFGTIIGGLLLKYVYDFNYTMMFVVAGAVRLILIQPLRTKKLGHAA